MSRFVSAPVCFSIKKQKEDASKEIKSSALPVEESSEDEEGSKTPPITENSFPPSTNGGNKIEPVVNGSKDHDAKAEENLVTELIDLTDDLQERRESRRGT